MSRLILLWLLLIQLSVTAQTPDSGFALIYLSSEVHYDARALKEEVKMQNSLQDVRQLVVKRIKDVSGKIIVTFHRDGSVWRWERNFGTKGEDGKDQEWIVLASRDPQRPVIKATSEFQTFFGDTLTLLDTIRIPVLIAGSSGNLNRYILRYKCGAKTILQKIPVTHSRELVIAVPDLPPSCRASGGGHALFYNAANPTVILADFQCWIPDATLEFEWLSIARGLREANPSLSEMDITDYLHSYIKDSHADCDKFQLRDWLLRKSG